MEPERTRIKAACLLACLLACLTLTGCNDGVVSFEALVLLDGQPLPDATVSFIRTDGEMGRAAYGMTDTEGKTQLTTFKKHDGALPGVYSVVVIKAQQTPGLAPSQEVVPQTTEELLMSSAPRLQAMRRAARPPVSAVSKVYSSPRTTPLSCEVVSGMEDPVFELITP